MDDVFHGNDDSDAAVSARVSKVINGICMKSEPESVKFTHGSCCNIDHSLWMHSVDYYYSKTPLNSCNESCSCTDVKVFVGRAGTEKEGKTMLCRSISTGRHTMFHLANWNIEESDCGPSVLHDTQLFLRSHGVVKELLG